MISSPSRAPLFWLAIAACLGILVGQQIALAPFWTLQAAVVCAVVSFFPSCRRVFVLLMCFFTFWFYTQARSTFGGTDLRALLSNSSQTATVTGMVSDFPILKENYKNQKYWQFHVEVSSVEQFGEQRTAHGSILATLPLTEQAADPLYGDVVRWTGQVSPPPRPNNLGHFDYRRYLAAKNVFFICKIDPKNIDWLARDQGHWLMKTAGLVRQAMIVNLSNNPWWPDKELRGPWLTFESQSQISSIMGAMLFGFREGVSDEIEDSFRDTGTLHLFAVSGQNVAVITVILIALLQAMGLIRWRWGWVLIPPVFIFCLSTGMQPSAARAFLMASLLFVGWVFHRPIQPYNILGASALFLLILEPTGIHDIGFQLSFLVVLALLVCAGKIGDALTHIYEADPWIPVRLLTPAQKIKYSLFRGICLTVGVSVAAWIGSAPLSALYFHQFSPITVLANTLIAPLADSVIIICGFSVLAGLVWPMASLLLNACNSLLVQMILWVVMFLAQIPGGHFYVTLDPARWAGKVSMIHMIATDGSTPTIVEHRGGSWLIDPGSEITWKFHTDSLRRSLGINKWSGIIVSQQNNSHMGILAERPYELPSDFYADSGTGSRSPRYSDWVKVAANKKLGRQFWRSGDKLKLKRDFSCTVLWPPAGIDNARSEDDSLVMLIQLEGTILLWAGAISSDTESLILARYPDLRADILYQAPNSKLPNLSDAWIEAIKPQAIIRPSSRFVRDYVVDEVFLQNMEARSIRVYEMEKSGGLKIFPQEHSFAIMDFASHRRTVFPYSSIPPLQPTALPPPSAPMITTPETAPSH